MNALGRLKQVHLERPGDVVVDGAAGGFEIDAHLAAGELACPDVAQGGLGIRQGWLRAAALVARRPRNDAGAARPDVQATGAIKIGDAAAPRSYFGDVDARRPHRLAA